MHAICCKSSSAYLPVPAASCSGAPVQRLAASHTCSGVASQMHGHRAAADPTCTTCAGAPASCHPAADASDVMLLPAGGLGRARRRHAVAHEALELALQEWRPLPAPGQGSPCCASCSVPCTPQGPAGPCCPGPRVSQTHPTLYSQIDLFPFHPCMCTRQHVLSVCRVVPCVATVPHALLISPSCNRV